MPTKKQARRAQKNDRAKAQKKANMESNPMSLHDIFIQKLQALYDIEKQLVKALPKMAKQAHDASLQAGFEEHLEQTKEHVTRLERAFVLLEEKPRSLQSSAIRGLIEDASWVMHHVYGKEALDANLIAAAQYVEHYEMAGYGAALAWARLMNHTEVADLLELTLREEIETDQKLTKLAESKINDRALRANPDGMPIDHDLSHKIE
jgi:ferritin-like metal-binding protein YciE